jgi:hypothetical protein
MWDVDAINRRYDTGLIKTYMMKEAALHNESLRCHPHLYAVPNVRYVNRRLSAGPPPPSASNLIDPGTTRTLMMTICSPRTRLRTDHCRPFRPTCVTEISVNTLVMHSIERDTIVWASLDAGFPTVPWKLSQVCNKFSFHLVSPLPRAKPNQLQSTFAGSSVTQHLTSGTAFLESDEYPVACQGFDATGPIADTTIQTAWLRKVLEHTESAQGTNVNCMILIIPLTSVLVGSAPFDECMIRPIGINISWAYKAGILSSTLCQDIVATTRWVCVATRAKGSQQQQVPLLTAPSSKQRNCYSCMDSRHDLAENGICTLTQLDADRMHATPVTFEFLPLVLAHTAPPESCTTDRNISVLHPSFPCIEPTCFGNADMDRWPAVIFLDEFGVHRIRLLTTDELLLAYDIPVPMQDAYACARALQCNVSLRLASCVPSRTAHTLAEPILDFLLGDRQDPDDTNPVPRSVSVFITSGMPTQDDWAQAYDEDPDCKFMMTHLSGEWSAAKVKKVNACYRQPLLQGYINMVNNLLCITHFVDGHTHLLLLVIVPSSI